jgi:hypothetical protein
MPEANWDQEFSRILREPENLEKRAPSSLKARLYTALIREQQSTGPLSSLDATVAAGRTVCVFEKLVQILPVPDERKTPFFCSICHARILGEHIEQAPIFWSNCPYVAFKKP